MNSYRQFLEEHKNEFGLDISKLWWIKYVYHFSNIDNIVNILEQGSLYSRNECIRRGIMGNENASTEIIDQTEDEIRNCVRLYFRPKTPTQFYNEGYSTSQERDRYNSAHIPVPIFLAFRSYEILNLPTTRFSDCSLATHGFHLYENFEDFKKLDFKSIYHDGALREDEKTYIVQKRQSEIIVKSKLSLEYLDMIWCRSNAEYVTLINILSEKGVLEKYRDKISVKQASNLFYMHHVYIDHVNMNLDNIRIDLKNVSTMYPIEMRVDVMIGDISYPKFVTLQPKKFYNYDLMPLRNSIEQNSGYLCKIYFFDKTVNGDEGTQVYYGKWSFNLDLPF